MEKTMTVKNEDMLSMKNVIEKYQKQFTEANMYVDPRIAYLFGRNLRILKSQLQDFEVEESNLLKQYGSVKQDGGNTFYSINKNENPENFDTFVAERKKLLAIEHEITLFTEDFNSLENPFNFQDLCNLWFLID